MTRPGRLCGAALLSLASAAPALAPADREAQAGAVAATAAEEGSAAAPATSVDMTPRLRIQQLATELALVAERGPLDPDELRRTADQLRAAASAYRAALAETERPRPPATPEGRKVAQPITPQRVERPGSSAPPQAGSAELQGRQETLTGTHLAPSPEAMRARIGAGESPSAASPRELVRQLTDQLDELERLLSSQAPATTQISGITTRIQELAARLPATP
jgi:hypothetical protein